MTKGFAKLAFQFMKERMDLLQQQVDSLQSELQTERLEREALQKLVRQKLREAPRGTHQQDTAILLDDHNIRDFEDVRAIFDAAGSPSNSDSNVSQHTPTASTQKNAPNAKYMPEEPSETHRRASTLGLVGVPPSSLDANSQVTTPYPQGMLSSLLLRDYDQGHNGEDITTLINDAMAQNLRKRTLSNDFLLSQSQRARDADDVEAIQPAGYTPNSSLRNMPIFPLKLNTPTTPYNVPSVGPLKPPSQLGERDILEKWGIRFSEKYATISDIWNEYHRIGVKGVSIRSLERSFSNRWRTNLRRNVKKKYSRRFIIIRAIETGMKRGRTLEECFELLETVLRREKKPVSHLYRKANLPPEFT